MIRIRWADIVAMLGFMAVAVAAVLTFGGAA